MRYGKIVLSIPLVFSLINLNCSDMTKDETDSSLIHYHNSFENETDILNWNGVTIINLVDNPCPSGGEKSVYIAGGCIIPHASLLLDPPNDDLVVSVEFYGKNLTNGGGVELFIGDDFIHGVQVIVDDTSWKKYRSEEILWPTDSTMSIWMSAGGYITSSMLIDELEIIKTN